MPPFSSALLPLSLKEIGGLGPTEGSCVSRLPTIVTLRDVTKKRVIPDGVCRLFVFASHFCLWCPLVSEMVSVPNEVDVLVFLCRRGILCTFGRANRWKRNKGGRRSQRDRERSCTSCLPRPCLRQWEGTGAAFISSFLPPLTPLAPPSFNSLFFWSFFSLSLPLSLADKLYWTQEVELDRAPCYLVGRSGSRND